MEIFFLTRELAIIIFFKKIWIGFVEMFSLKKKHFFFKKKIWFVQLQKLGGKLISH